MVLTDKQRRFVDAKGGGASNKDAAIAAGYAASSAAAAGARLAKNPDILAALQKLKGRPNVKARNPDPPPVGDQDGGSEIDTAGGEFLTGLPDTDDPLLWLQALMNDPRAKIFDRRNAAQAALPYVHGKKGDVGKKELKADAAKAASKGKFSAGKPPLSVVKR
ncbi:terminase small subunit [Pseudomonas asplenii]|uniref:terminase small subunit n=1 Tax=Pseudomonas asplenii TaxID=53407 RepID=UPI0006B45873|nr:terminase small subunit [Pseudomonas fuscovaginae]KPA98106.1 phage terminase, small subunit [Pseudomonas fuscovaginae]